MNSANRILVISLSLALAVLVFELVRRKKLKEKYAILWLFSSSVILTLAIFDNILDKIAILLRIVIPANAVFFFGIFFIILINLHFTMVISMLSEQNKKLVQRLAFLEDKIANLANHLKT